jgi:hypothetical protein
MANAEQDPWALIVGPCYTEESCAHELNITVPELKTLADSLRVLRLQTADGSALYPAFQVRDGRVPAGLRTVLLSLQAGIDDPWTWAQWLNVEFSGARSIDALWAGELDSVLRDARQDAWAWRS